MWLFSLLLICTGANELRCPGLIEEDVGSFQAVIRQFEILRWPQSNWKYFEKQACEKVLPAIKHLQKEPKERRVPMFESKSDQWDPNGAPTRLMVYLYRVEGTTEEFAVRYEELDPSTENQVPIEVTIHFRDGSGRLSSGKEGTSVVRRFSGDAIGLDVMRHIYPPDTDFKGLEFDIRQGKSGRLLRPENPLRSQMREYEVEKLEVYVYGCVSQEGEPMMDERLQKLGHTMDIVVSIDSPQESQPSVWRSLRSKLPRWASRDYRRYGTLG